MSPATNDQEAGFGCFLMLIAAVVFLCASQFITPALTALHLWTWPVWAYLAASGIGWLGTLPGHEPNGHAEGSRRAEGRRPDGLARLLVSAAHSTLAYVWLGLGVLFLCLTALNASRQYFSAEELRNLEEELIHFKLDLRHLTDSLPLFLALLIGSLALSRLSPRWKVVARFAALRTMATAAYVVMVTVTSFTLFAQAPLHDMVDQHDHRNRERLASGNLVYHAILRQESDIVAKFLAAETLHSDLQQLSKPQRDQLQQEIVQASAAASGVRISYSEIFGCSKIKSRSGLPSRIEGTLVSIRSIERCLRLASLGRGGDRIAPDGTQRGAVRERLVRRIAAAEWSLSEPDAAQLVQELSAAPGHFENAELAFPSSRPPRDLEELNGQLRVLGRQDQRVEAERRRLEDVKTREAEARQAARMAISQLVGSQAPDLGGGLIDAYLQEALDRLVERAFGRAVTAWYARGRPLEGVNYWTNLLRTLAPKLRGRGAPPDHAFVDRVEREETSRVRASLKNATAADPPDFLITPVEMLERQNRWLAGIELNQRLLRSVTGGIGSPSGRLYGNPLGWRPSGEPSRAPRVFRIVP
ncbi:MAG TPA: hypothetical protein VHQ90_00535 [Thermoanaerobaculia bacterium]|nr:hypothetical protein [Thermoanaerobaculia bacterium]